MPGQRDPEDRSRPSAVRDPRPPAGDDDATLFAAPRLHPSALSTIQDLNGPSGSVIAVFAGKRGIGKTWFAVTLSHTLSQMRRQVVLVDADPRTANLESQLPVSALRDLEEHSGSGGAGRDTVIRSGVYPFDVLDRRRDANQWLSYQWDDLDAVDAGVAAVAKSYDHVVMDAGSGIGAVIRRRISQAGTVLLIVSADPAALGETYSSLRWLLNGDRYREIQVVVTSAESHDSGLAIYKTLATACEGLLGVSLKLAGVIRYDPCVPQAIRRRLPVPDVFPQSTAVEDVRTIATKLLSRS